MELCAIAHAQRLRLFIIEDFDLLLWRRWLKRRHEGCHAGHLRGVLAFSVDKVWHHHIFGPVEEINLAALSAAADYHLSSSIVLLDDFTVLG